MPLQMVTAAVPARRFGLLAEDADYNIVVRDQLWMEKTGQYISDLALLQEAVTTRWTTNFWSKFNLPHPIKTVMCFKFGRPHNS